MRADRLTKCEAVYADKKSLLSSLILFVLDKNW